MSLNEQPTLDLTKSAQQISRVRAKFQVTEIRRTVGPQTQVILKPVYSQDPAHENKVFWEATPNGQLEMWIKNEAAARTFEVGCEYYLDFTRVVS
jgi:hypothetical protein